MQTTKFLLVISAAALMVAPLRTLAGPDTEAQAKMREALRLKMAELNAATPPAAAPVAPPTVGTAPKPAPPAAPEPVVQVPTVVVPVPTDSSDADSAARMRESLRLKMEELNKPASAKVNPTTAPAMVAPAATTASTITAPQGDPDFQGNKVATDNAKTARMREALRLRMATLPEPAPTPIRTAAGMTFSPTPFANIPGPASPLSGAKQERLAELLQRYKMDAITPLDYHTQRAKIIAEP